MRADRLTGGACIVAGLAGLIFLGTVFGGDLPRTWSGHLTAVNPGQRVLVLAVQRESGHGDSLSMRVPPATRIQRFDEMLKIGDLAPGQLVDVTTRHGRQGTLEATSIRLRTAPKAADRQAGVPCPAPPDRARR